MSHRASRLLVTPILLVGLVAAVVGCGQGDQQGKTRLTVLAAASLTNAFGDLRDDYRREHPDIALRFSFAGSQQLVAQVRQGAPADVLATADEKTMRGVTEHVGEPAPFATNRLTMVVQKDNPKQVRELADLARNDVKVVLAGPTVPAGRYARQVLRKADVTVAPKSEPTDVRQVLTPVRLGEADAGVVYATDVTEAGGDELEAVPIPAEENLIATYPVATVDGSAHHDEAEQFDNYLRSADARKILEKHGFGAPKAR